MLTLENFNKMDEIKYIFIVRKEENAKQFIINEMEKRGVKNVHIVEIENKTDGQATSALLAKECWDESEEIIIYNIDTYVEPNAIRYQDIKGDGFIPCFKAEGTHWSFVKLNEQGEATEVREKQRISDNCTIGLYYFKSCQLYEELYQEYYKEMNNIEQNEKYIAPLYNHMIKKGMKVKIMDIPQKQVHVLGTPEELEVFSRSPLCL